MYIIPTARSPSLWESTCRHAARCRPQGGHAANGAAQGHFCCRAERDLGFAQTKEEFGRIGYAILHDDLRLDDVFVAREHQRFFMHALPAAEAHLDPADLLDAHHIGPLEWPRETVV